MVAVFVVVLLTALQQKLCENWKAYNERKEGGTDKRTMEKRKRNIQNVHGYASLEFSSCRRKWIVSGSGSIREYIYGTRKRQYSETDSFEVPSIPLITSHLSRRLKCTPTPDRACASKTSKHLLSRERIG